MFPGRPPVGGMLNGLNAPRMAGAARPAGLLAPAAPVSPSALSLLSKPRMKKAAPVRAPKTPKMPASRMPGAGSPM